MYILENKTSPERERILTSSSRKRPKHPVEQREKLKGELIHQMLHEMRMDESKLSISQLHCVQSGKRCPSPQQRTGSCCRKYIFKLHWEKPLWKRSNRGNQSLSTPASFFSSLRLYEMRESCAPMRESLSDCLHFSTLYFLPHWFLLVKGSLPGNREFMGIRY